jgi:predicted transposase YdaD
MQFDTTIKEIFQSLPLRLLQMLCGSEIAELLTVEQPSVKMRKPDFVARLKDGRIFHLEIQSGDDANMPWRMLEYYPPIRREYGQPPIQVVLYVGYETLNIASKIEEDRLSFSYIVIDIRELDGEPLIESDSPADNLIAILCRVDDVREASRRVLKKLLQLPGKQARDAVTKLLILSRLRKSEKIVSEEVKQAMQLTREDVMEIPLFAEIILESEKLAEKRGEKKGEKRGEKKGEKRGEKKGEEAIFSAMLEARFGPMPEWAKSKIAEADTDALKRWGVRLLEAESLEEVFAADCAS